MASLVRVLRTTLSWTSFSVGGVLNALLIWLILKHTPASMRVYSKVNLM
jgi:hypothetical protein